MIATIAEFIHLWKSESSATEQIFSALIDTALNQQVNPEGRTLARLAWHIIQTIPEMAGRTGLHIAGPHEDTPVISSARGILETYHLTSKSLVDEITNRWKESDLLIEDEMYGERWNRAFTLQALISHQIHHRGQMTVLMRQAGLIVPGIYGPAREGWSAIGMNPPAI